MLLDDDIVAYGRRLIDKPKPVPCPVGFVVKNGLKIFSRMSSGMPLPQKRNLFFGHAQKYSLAFLIMNF
jgi:hypothetical protein